MTGASQLRRRRMTMRGERVGSVPVKTKEIQSKRQRCAATPYLSFPCTAISLQTYFVPPESVIRAAAGSRFFSAMQAKDRNPAAWQTEHDDYDPYFGDDFRTAAPEPLAMDGYHPKPALTRAAAAATVFTSPEAAQSAASSARPATKSEARSATGRRNVHAIFFCFFSPDGAKPRSTLSALVFWGVDLFKERFVHVECLFNFGGDPQDQKNWQALSVSEARGSGIFGRKPSYYRDGRWAVLRMCDMQQTLRNRMYDFAVAEARRRRSYNRGMLLSTLPGLSLCTPVVYYTPGCKTCIGTGPNTVYCVQLMVELLAQVFPLEYRDLRSDTLRPDGFHRALCARSKVECCMFSLEVKDEVTVRKALLKDAEASVWDPPMAEF